MENDTCTSVERQEGTVPVFVLWLQASRMLTSYRLPVASIVSAGIERVGNISEALMGAY